MGGDDWPMGCPGPEAFAGHNWSEDPDIPEVVTYKSTDPPPGSQIAAAMAMKKKGTGQESSRGDGYDQARVSSWISETTGMDLPATPADSRGSDRGGDPVYMNAVGQATLNAGASEYVSRSMFPPVAQGNVSYAPSPTRDMDDSWPPKATDSPASVQRVNFDVAPAFPESLGTSAPAEEAKSPGMLAGESFDEALRCAKEAKASALKLPSPQEKLPGRR